jgi:transcriptional antiterminator RfaH
MVTSLSSSDSQKWYCVTTLPKRERLAAAAISQRMGFESFAPCHYFVRKTPTGKKRFLEAIFPCYIFVLCDIRPHVRQIVSMNGVRGVVHYGNDIPAVDSRLVESIREDIESLGDDAVEDKIHIGDVVEVIGGPFKSFTAKVLSSPDSTYRISCLLELLGRTVEVKIQETDLFVSPTASPHAYNAVSVM